MPVDKDVLLTDLRKLVRTLEQDLHARIDTDASLLDRVKREWQAARDVQRTADTESKWITAQVAQAAAAWVLAAVFVRFLEDNGLLPEPWITGVGERARMASDRREHYFQQHPVHSDRDYLEIAFAEMASLPGTGPIFDRKHNALWQLPISGDAAGDLLRFFKSIDANTGRLHHDFRDESWDTRFLGDLYQDLSQDAKKRYALLQTPEFVEEFILDRTLTPAIETFGFEQVRLIDPACGSGHFLLGAFRRLLALWERHAPNLDERERVQRALAAVHGVDLNPFATNIAHFRLLIAALRASGIARLVDAPDYRFQLATGDSLLHGKRFAIGAKAYQLGLDEHDPLRQHVFAAEDREELLRILGQQYHAVVGNPPYITVKDASLREAYRNRFQACSRKYSLVVPFLERFFELAQGGADDTERAGFVGAIVSNSFVKREFGKKLIEEFIPGWDVSHLIDTSGAYIPGHGTPTLIMFGRNRKPMTASVRAVLGIRGEPATPEDPARGLVWTSILEFVDRPGEQNLFVSTEEVPRTELREHPWVLAGGGARDLKKHLDDSRDKVLGDTCKSIGFASFPGLDDAFVAKKRDWLRKRIEPQLSRVFVFGEAVRDWSVEHSAEALVPYDKNLNRLSYAPDGWWCRHLWRLKTNLGSVTSFGNKTRQELGEDWWTWYRWVPGKYRTPLSIAFAFVATHNHFVLDRGGKVFNRSAPVIKLPAEAPEEDHYALLGLLNSSVACFWMKMNFFNKGDSTDKAGARVTGEPEFDTYEHDGTKLKRFPIVGDAPLGLTSQIHALAASREAPGEIVNSRKGSIAGFLAKAEADDRRTQTAMIALQEELDWRCYRLYGVTDVDLATEQPPGIELGERAFEIHLARQIAGGEVQSNWFERHGSKPITDIPAHWPSEYRALVRRRLDAIASNPWIALLERPEYKRRWAEDPWDARVKSALREWLCDRLEAPELWEGSDPRLQTTATLSDRLAADERFHEVARLYTGEAAPDRAALVRELVESEGVPFLPVLRHTPTGLRKRSEWEHVWELQRREDAIDARAGLPTDHPQHLSIAEAEKRKQREVGKIPVPPEYKDIDFQGGSSWSHRGKLDVPKERFVLYPHLEREADPSPVVGWAGWDHLQRAKALATYYTERVERDGWDASRVAPILAGIHDLLPWLLQWHDDVLPEYGLGLGTYFKGFLEEETRRHGLTLDDLRKWSPPDTTRKPRRRGRTRA